MSDFREITVRPEDKVVFRLDEGCRPLVYPDLVTRVAYETGFSVTHAGTVWSIHMLDDVPVLELDDSTVVVGADIDVSTLTVNQISLLPLHMDAENPYGCTSVMFDAPGGEGP